MDPVVKRQKFNSIAPLHILGYHFIGNYRFEHYRIRCTAEQKHINTALTPRHIYLNARIVKCAGRRSGRPITPSVEHSPTNNTIMYCIQHIPSQIGLPK